MSYAETFITVAFPRQMARRSGDTTGSIFLPARRLLRYQRLWLSLEMTGISSMRQTVLIAIFAIGFLVAPPSTAASRDVTIVNETGYGIKFLGVNSVGDDNWTKNRVMSVIRDGTSTQVRLGDGICQWNIRVEWATDLMPLALNDVELCSVRVVTLHYDEGTKTLSYDKR